MNITELFRNDEHRWNAIFILVYIILVFILAGFVWLVDRRFPAEISFFDFAILSLATFRLVRLFIYDRVMLFVREFFMSSISGPRRVAGELMHCPWCFGLWAGTFVVFFYFVMPMAWLVLLILAVSGVGSFIQILINLVGWRAELSKLEAEKK